MSELARLAPLSAPGLGDGIRTRFIDPVNGLRLHILEAGYETPGGRCFCCCMDFRNWPTAGEK